MATKVTISVMAQTSINLANALEEIERMVREKFTSGSAVSEDCEFSFVADLNFTMGSGPTEVA